VVVLLTIITVTGALEGTFRTVRKVFVWSRCMSMLLHGQKDEQTDKRSDRQTDLPLAIVRANNISNQSINQSINQYSFRPISSLSKRKPAIHNSHTRCIGSRVMRLIFVFIQHSYDELGV